MRKKVAIKRRMQKRAESLKALHEQRCDHIRRMKELSDTAETEKRAFSEEEENEFDDLEKKVQALDKTITRVERARALNARSAGNGESKNATEKEQKEREERAFEDYVRRACGAENLQLRTGEQNLTMGSNGAIIPTTIANRIITVVKDICPIFSKATMYQVNGTLKIPVWGEASGKHDITVGYQEEFTEITADVGKFTSVDLSGYLAGALALIGRSVINNAQFDVVSFIVIEMAKKIAEFLEKELLIGSSGKAEGALSTKTSVTAESATAISADDLITVQASVKQAYQKEACWTMSPTTFAAVRKLKDKNGRYLLQDDITGDFPYRLLGKPVFVSDNMPEIAASAKPVLYGDYSGLSVNMRENIQIQILLEKYATQHAVGVVGWFEFDSKVSEHQKLATLTMKSA